jgi:hypothetical protein
MIEDMKRNSLNDREFIQKELLKRIDDLERELKEVKENYKN